MPTYRTPDVYVEEIPLFPPSVAEVETAIPAFIGYTDKAKETSDDDLLNKPHRIRSMIEYETYFGGAMAESFDIELIENIDTGTFEVKAKRKTDGTFYRMYYSLKMFFANGGGSCYVVSVGRYGAQISKGDAANSTGLLGGLAKIEKEDEPTILVFPDAVELTSSADYYEVLNAALVQCNKLMDRVAVIDIYEENVDLFRGKVQGQGGIAGGLDFFKYGAAYHPFVVTTLNYDYKDESAVSITKHVDQAGNNPATDLTGKTLDSNDIKEEKNALYNQIKAEINVTIQRDS